MIRLCVLAPVGRMGKQVALLAGAVPDLRFASAFTRNPGTCSEGLPSQVLLTDDLHAALQASDVYIDFSTPELSELAATAAIQTKTAAVVGTTGLSEPAIKALSDLSQVAPVLVAANFSPGVAALMHLAEEAARALGPDYDLEVVELHHRNKVDSPSGTALALGKSLAKGRGIDFEENKRCAREGQVGPRSKNEIGLQALRGGDIVGEHTAYLVADDERIEISHRAQKRSVFASGALRAALWLPSQAPGSYSMKDLLGMSPTHD